MSILAKTPGALDYARECVPELAHLITPDKSDAAIIGTLRPWQRMEIVLEFALQFNSDETRDFLRIVWPDVEAPFQWGYDRLLQLFRKARFTLGEDGMARPTEPLTVYRGVSRPRLRHGISWTTNREIAEFFALRTMHPDLLPSAQRPSIGEGVVYKATADPERVLGCFGEREECEIVIDPANLRDVKIVARGLTFGDMPLDPRK